MAFDGFELREFPLYILRGMDEETDIGFEQHSGVVVGITGGDDVIIQLFQGGDGFPFLVGDAQLVIYDAVVFDDELVTEERRPIKVAQERGGELLEGIRENDDLGEGTQFVQEFPGAGERLERADDVLDVGKLEMMPVEDFQASAHELVIIRFVAGGAAQFGDFGLFGDGNPNFRRQDAFHVQGDN